MKVGTRYVLRSSSDAHETGLVESVKVRRRIGEAAQSSATLDKFEEGKTYAVQIMIWTNDG